MEVRRVRALHVDSIVTTRPFPSPQITFYRLRKRASVIRMHVDLVSIDQKIYLRIKNYLLYLLELKLTLNN